MGRLGCLARRADRRAGGTCAGSRALERRTGAPRPQAECPDGPVSLGLRDDGNAGLAPEPQPQHPLPTALYRIHSRQPQDVRKLEPSRSGLGHDWIPLCWSTERTTYKPGTPASLVLMCCIIWLPMTLIGWIQIATPTPPTRRVATAGLLTILHSCRCGISPSSDLQIPKHARQFLSSRLL